MAKMQPIPASTEAVSKAVVHAAYTVHRNLGPGLLESVYEVCFLRELQKAGLTFRRQVSVPVRYDDVVLRAALKLDVLVEESVVCELKAVEQLLPIHKAQLLTYLRLSGKRLGLLINFNVETIKSGISRVVL